MKILFITTGSGDSFYCGNCLRDVSYAKALMDYGHEVIFMPLYMPVRIPGNSNPKNSNSKNSNPKNSSSENNNSGSPVFFGAIGFFVAQQWFKNKGLPGWLRKWFNKPYFMKLAASRAGSTRVKGLEEHTLSMIEGNNTAFKVEAKKLTAWIKTDMPDIIHLSNSLIIGLAPVLKAEFDIPVVCSLQDEDTWIDNMEDGYRQRAWNGILNNSKYLDGLVTVSHFYRRKIKEILPDLPDIEIVYTGYSGNSGHDTVTKVDAKAKAKVNAKAGVKVDAKAKTEAGPVIGFLSRMSYSYGLDILAEAFIILKKRNTIPGLRLHIAGGLTSDNNKFIKNIKQILKPYDKYVHIEEGTCDKTDTSIFLSEISVLSVPLRIEEAFCFFLCEAFASGIPVIQPDIGSCREVVGTAGKIYTPNIPFALADELEKVLSDNGTMLRLQKEAISVSRNRFGPEAMADNLTQFYSGVIKAPKRV